MRDAFDAPYWGAWRYKQLRKVFQVDWKRNKWIEPVREKFLRLFDEKADIAFKYDMLKKAIKKKAQGKGIKPGENKKLKWWDWQDFEHEAIAQSL
jgi:hypothetical protein